MTVATKPRTILRYPIHIVQEEDSWGAYVIGLPITAIDDTKTKVKRRIAEALRFYLAHRSVLVKTSSSC